METYLVRLKHHDPKRGHVLRRYTYRGLRFQLERGWYRVDKAMAEYLSSVRQLPSDPHSPLAFDVCTPSEAEQLDVEEAKESKPTLAVDAIELSVARDEAVQARKPRGEESKSKRAKASVPEAEPSNT